MFTEPGRLSILLSRILTTLVTTSTSLLLSALAGAFAASAGAWQNDDPTTTLVLESGLLGGFLFAFLPSIFAFYEDLLSTYSELYIHDASKPPPRSHNSEWREPSFGELASRGAYYVVKYGAKPLSAIVTSSLVLRFSEDAWDHLFAIHLGALAGWGISNVDIDFLKLGEEKEGNLVHESQRIGWHGLAGMVVVRVARFSGFYMCRTTAGLFAGLVYGSIMWSRHLPQWTFGKVQKARWRMMDEKLALGGRNSGGYERHAAGGRAWEKDESKSA